MSRNRLLERTIYRTPIPFRWPPRLRSAASRALRWGGRNPGYLFDSLNVFRYGKPAASLRMIHERFPEPGFRQDFDVIHCHYGPNGQWAVGMRDLGLLRAPIVTTFHGYDANMLPRIRGPELYRELFQRGDLFTVGSEFMRRRILTLGAPAQRIVQLPMGVDVAQYAFTRRTQTKAGELRLLTVARLVEVKGLEYALRAVALARKSHPGLNYCIAGDGPLRGRLEALAAELGLGSVVEFKGAVTHETVRALLDSAHAFVLPSVVTDSGEEENQPVVLAEAQATGLPVVASAIGGISESIRENETGILVPPRNPEALAAALVWLAEHPERWGEMGQAGRALVEKRFNLETLNDELEEIYRGLGASATREG